MEKERKRDRERERDKKRKLSYKAGNQNMYEESVKKEKL